MGVPHVLSDSGSMRSPQSIGSLRFRYGIKSLLPRGAVVRIRQAIAQRKLTSVQDVWPILESAGAPPAEWTGWPEGRQFAFVISHDVDTQRGLDRCLQLADLEERLGFRSAFYFVPTGRYEVSKALRDELVCRGFEVGVHGLCHDWHTFTSCRVFEERAPRINQYLKEWGAVGFRAPSMIRNLDWIRELDVEYDASTFDTDPFEPQPEGMGTIFPFWVDGHGSRSGYVELPYTLPQDHTLFVLLKAGSSDVWKRKLDWIAIKGGMAMLDTHPDYMTFDSDLHGIDTYPVDRYQEILEHIVTKYSGRCWSVLPREMARFWKKCPKRTRPHSKKRICMMAYSFYDNDNRIMRYAEALAGRGDSVDVITLRGDGRPQHGNINGVNVNRIQRRLRDEKGQISYLFRIMRFWVKSSVVLAWNHLKSPYDLIHVHSVPDFEVFAAWLPKLMGAKVILDIHDLVPEFYASKFQVKHKTLVFRLLVWLERVSARFADHVIAANDIWFGTLTSRSVPVKKCSVFVNYLDLKLFFRRPRTRTDDKFIIVYPGGLQWHQGVDVAIKAFVRIIDQIPNAEFHVYGGGPEKENLKHLVEELNLQNQVILKGVYPLLEIPEIMANADLGVVPKRAESFGNEAYSTKILEYMSQGVPVVVSRTKIDTHYFDDSVVQFFDSGNAQELANAVVLVAQDEGVRSRLIQKGFEYVNRYSWDFKKKEYLDLVDTLIG